MFRIAIFLAILTVCISGCGPDQELVASGKVHLQDIQRLQSQLEDAPNDEKLKEELRNSCIYYREIISYAGEGAKARNALRDEIFKGVSEAKRKELLTLIHSTR